MSFAVRIFCQLFEIRIKNCIVNQFFITLVMVNLTIIEKSFKKALKTTGHLSALNQ
jgi:hypothetical protein